MESYTIHEDDLTGDQIVALLQLHLDEMRAWSPPEGVHAFPVERLRGDDVTFYAAWQGDRLAACGAIKQLDPVHGELKSMRPLRRLPRRPLQPFHDEDTVSEPTFRLATLADVPALSALAIDSFVAKFGHLYGAEDLTAFLAENLAEAPVADDVANPGIAYRLAEADGRLLAFCKLGLKCGFPEHARGRNVMELKSLYTAADATGMGLGSRLMDWAMAEFAARGADEVQLSVYAFNEGAQRFYHRYGFAKVADITFKVGDHYDPEFLFGKML